MSCLIKVSSWRLCYFAMMGHLPAACSEMMNCSIAFCWILKKLHSAFFFPPPLLPADPTSQPDNSSLLWAIQVPLSPLIHPLFYSTPCLSTYSSVSKFKQRAFSPLFCRNLTIRRCQKTQSGPKTIKKSLLVIFFIFFMEAGELKKKHWHYDLSVKCKCECKSGAPFELEGTNAASNCVSKLCSTLAYFHSATAVITLAFW